MSVYAMLSGIIWCNILICFVNLIGKKASLISKFSLIPLLGLLYICILRLFFTYEVLDSIVIPSYLLLPAIVKFLTVTRFYIFSAAVSIADLLLCIWILGIAMMFIKEIKGILSLRRYLSAAEFIGHEEVELQSRNLKLAIYELRGIPSPIIFGFFKPRVYLPSIHFTPDELNIILNHEATHYLHKDSWAKLLVSILCIIFWWNPFSYMLKRNLNHILELYCDNSNISNVDEKGKVLYMETMLKVLKYQLSNKCNDLDLEKDFCYMASVFASGCKEKQIQQRFELISQNKGKTPKRKALVVYFIVAVVFLGSNLFVIQPNFPCPEEEGTFSITPDNAYLVRNNYRTYSLFVDGEYKTELSEELISSEPFSSLTISSE